MGWGRGGLLTWLRVWPLPSQSPVIHSAFPVTPLTCAHLWPPCFPPVPLSSLSSPRLYRSWRPCAVGNGTRPLSMRSPVSPPPRAALSLSQGHCSASFLLQVSVRSGEWEASGPQGWGNLWSCHPKGCALAAGPAHTKMCPVQNLLLRFWLWKAAPPPVQGMRVIGAQGFFKPQKASMKGYVPLRPTGLGKVSPDALPASLLGGGLLSQLHAQWWVAASHVYTVDKKNIGRWKTLCFLQFSEYIIDINVSLPFQNGWASASLASWK